MNEDFDFFSKTLRGVPQLRPRWKRCVGLVDRQLGEALGQEFVSRTFTPEMKQKTLTMTNQIEQAMADDIEQLTWMGPETKQNALAKLHAIVNKIGYPDKWRDYTSVAISRDDFSGNVERATVFESRRRLNKIGKPVDRGEWSMTPPTVNAYYSSAMNDINFPAGVLQPPLYDPEDGRRAELRQHRRNHRSRVDPWLRRSGAQVRRPGQLEGLVDRSRTTRISRPARSAWWISTRSTSSWTT